MVFFYNEPEWVPLERFSDILFGPSIICSRTVGPGAVELQEGSSFKAEAEALRGLFRRKDDPGCEIRTILGDVHEVCVSSICRFRGVNLISSMVDPTLTLLGNPQVSWTYADPSQRTQLDGVVAGWGLVMHAADARGPIMSVTLRGPDRDHRKRERILSIASKQEVANQA